MAKKSTSTTRKRSTSTTKKGKSGGTRKKSTVAKKRSTSSAPKVDYEKQYFQELDIIKDTINFMKKENFYVSEDVLQAVEHWSNQKRIGKASVERLKGVTYKVLKSTSSYLDEETGELIPNTPENATRIFNLQTYGKKSKYNPDNRELKHIKRTVPKEEPHMDKNFSVGSYDGEEYSSSEISSEDLPSFSNYERAKELIMNGPDMVSFHKGGTRNEWVTVSTDDYKQQMVSMLDDLYGNMENFDQYMEDNFGSLEDALESFYSDSDGVYVENGFASAMNILSGPGTMSSDSAYLAGAIGDSLGL